MTDVSIVVPCRNAERWIAQTLRSALAQHAPPCEIIVVDDGSTDRSAEIAEGFGPPVRVIREHGRGASWARRRGAEEATGHFLMFLDADDLLTPDTLGALARGLRGCTGPAVALCPWDRYESVGGIWIAKPPSNLPAAPWADPLSAWLREAWSPPCAVMWTRSGYDLSGQWDEAVSLDDDGELMRRAFARGVHAVRVREGLALYRRVPGSLSSRGKTAEGAVAAIGVLERLAGELQGSSRPGRYRAALVAAAEAVGRRQGADRGVRARVDALITRAGGRRRTDALRTRAYAMAARAGAALGPRFGTRLPDAPRDVPDATSGSLRNAAPDPLVSVVIPTHERPAHTVAAVKSVLAQSYRRIEVIVVDDASTDDTPDRIRAMPDPRLRLIVQPDNRGVAVARNTGIAAATGEFIAFLDSDDLWRPEKLARQVEALAAAPAHVGICQCGSEILAEDGPGHVHRPEAGGRFFQTLLLHNALHGGGSSVLLRRAVIDAIGGYDKDLPAAEDWELFQRAARLFDVICVPEPLVVLREDAPGPRRSRRVQANMDARRMIFDRNRHALRRARTAHLFLIDSARRELKNRDGGARRSARLACRALAERPFSRSAWVQIRYGLMPWGLRSWLRTVVFRSHRRTSTPDAPKEMSPSAGAAHLGGNR